MSANDPKQTPRNFALLRRPGIADWSSALRMRAQRSLFRLVGKDSESLPVFLWKLGIDTTSVECQRVLPCSDTTPAASREARLFTAFYCSSIPDDAAQKRGSASSFGGQSTSRQEPLRARIS